MHMVVIECAKKETIELVILPAVNHLSGSATEAASASSSDITLILLLFAVFVLLLVIAIMIVPTRMLFPKKAKSVNRVAHPAPRPNITFY
jgi:hypothetical protein